MNNYKYVNTRMGTQNDFRFSNGNVLPITAIPYGMASFTIQTEIGKKRGWFYSPYSKSFEGIRLTHQPSPWLGDYGELIIYPWQWGWDPSPGPDSCPEGSGSRYAAFDVPGGKWTDSCGSPHFLPGPVHPQWRKCPF